MNFFDKIYNNELIYPDYTFNNINQFWDNGKYKVTGFHIPTDKYTKGFQFKGIVGIKNKKCLKTINLSWNVCRSIGKKCIVSQQYFLLPAVDSSEQNKIWMTSHTTLGSNEQGRVYFLNKNTIVT